MSMFALLGVFLVLSCSQTPSTNATEHHKKLSANAVGSFVLTSKSNHGNSLANTILRRFKRSVKPTYESLAVVTRVTSRFAQTTFSSTISNHATEDSEVQFTVHLPETAFISNVTMIIDGELYVGIVKSREEALKEYEEAKKQDKTAGQISASDTPPVNGMQAFTTSVNIAANSSTELTLSYQELIKRRLGIYQIILSIRPNQIVEELSADVYIYEPEGIKFLEVQEPGSNDTTITEISNTTRHVNYNPPIDVQRAMDPVNGTNGDLIIKYDVFHSNDPGFVVVEEDHFLHYFSPDGRSPLPKNIIFVIDISHSMAGDKMNQTREALLVILDQLRTGDKFQILVFNHEIKTWPNENELAEVSMNTLGEAKKYAQETLKAEGNTNINDALVSAVKTLSKYEQPGASMIVFLTDGQPTAGVTNAESIVENVVTSAQGKVTIFSLGFGYSLDYELLEMLAYRTGGEARRIYEDSSGNIQLQNFFKEVGTPVFYDVAITYSEEAVVSDSMTKTQFSEYFNGSEIVVAGKLQKNLSNTWTIKVVGKTNEQETLIKTVYTEEAAMVPPEAHQAVTRGFAEKLYVYMKIKDLLRQTLVVDDVKEKTDLEKQALNLALEYQLVTPLTSMITIVQHEKTENNTNIMIHGIRESTPDNNDLDIWSYDKEDEGFNPFMLMPLPSIILGIVLSVIVVKCIIYWENKKKKTQSRSSEDS